MSITMPEEVQHRPVKSRRRPPAARKLFDPEITKQAIKDSFVKLNPVAGQEPGHVRRGGRRRADDRLRGS